MDTREHIHPRSVWWLTEFLNRAAFEAGIPSRHECLGENMCLNEGLNWLLSRGASDTGTKLDATHTGQITREPPRPIAGEQQIIWAPPFRRAHGGADERLIIQDGQALRESDGELVRQPEPRIELPKMGVVMGETD